MIFVYNVPNTAVFTDVMLFGTDVMSLQLIRASAGPSNMTLGKVPSKKPVCG